MLKYGNSLYWQVGKMKLFRVAESLSGMSVMWELACEYSRLLSRPATTGETRAKRVCNLQQKIPYW